MVVQESIDDVADAEDLGRAVRNALVGQVGMIDADDIVRFEESPDHSVPTGQVQRPAFFFHPGGQDGVIVEHPPFGEPFEAMMIGSLVPVFLFKIFHFQQATAVGSETARFHFEDYSMRTDN